MPSFAITYTDNSQLSIAENLAKDLQLPLTHNPECADYNFLLTSTPHYLGLINTADKKFKPFYLDFLSETITYRVKQASLNKELLARAIGKHPRDNPSIIDATAGLGRDSFILAALGFNITMLEQSPILHALLKDAMNRAKIHTETAAIIERMNLIHANALTWLTNKQADVVYLDPMFPARQKSAAVKKEMAVLQALVDKPDNNSDLFKAALACAKYRIVIKRPRLAENITPLTPNFTLWGKINRFDIYLGVIA